ncbi:uncharacterized protein K02A2.6-like [Octopus sinensis]|uniref:Uncharacterized protein K02A2.6-like n=1 Tax=Octopus sinensis TaxID=2607531 RepID=A0A7E6F7H5_9MOLL|nr:uncharacterized protein K02A2.6-like [Octopus sinensis]
MYHYPLPSPEDSFAKLNGNKIFSKLDLSDASLQIKADEECSKFLTVNTPKGLYKYNRLPFGLKVTPAIFQQVVDAMLADCKFAIPYLDDLLIKIESDDQMYHTHQTAIKTRSTLEVGIVSRFKDSPKLTCHSDKRQTYCLETRGQSRTSNSGSITVISTAIV